MTTCEITNTTPAGMTALDDALDDDRSAVAADADELAAPKHLTSDDFFGDATQCAADAAFIKRLSLIVVPALIALCLLTLALTQFGAAT
jgi:hypothetical protein